MAVRSAETFEAYRTTTIPVHESQADVRELLRNRKATGMQISESWAAEEAFADVRFAMPADAGGYYAYRIRVRVPNDPPPERREQRGAHRVIPPTAADVRAHQAKLERQIWRLVYWWLKAQFEAAEAGLLALEEAFLPWMELPDGRTVYETAEQSGGLAAVAAGTSPALLGSGR
jgi:hypothetical protein